MAILFCDTVMGVHLHCGDAVDADAEPGEDTAEYGLRAMGLRIMRYGLTRAFKSVELGLTQASDNRVNQQAEALIYYPSSHRSLGTQELGRKKRQAEAEIKVCTNYLIS